MSTTGKNYYKKHLKDAMTSSRSHPKCSETQEDQQQLASPGASILSSVHSSSNNNEESSSSFLSLTPSMLNSSILEQHQQNQSSSSCIDVSSINSTEGPRNAAQQLEEEIEEPWHDRSTFESIANSLLMTESVIEQKYHRTATTIKKNIQEKEEDINNSEHEEDPITKEKTALGSALQIGTIVAGIAGILLILSGFGDNGAAKKRNKKNKKETPGSTGDPNNRMSRKW